MNLRLWMRVFLSQFLLLLGIVFLGLGLGVLYVDSVSWKLIFSAKFLGMPLLVVILAFCVAIALVYSWFLSHELVEPYEELKAQINWLLLGKYNHEVFSDDKPRDSWYSGHDHLTYDLRALRDKIVQLNNDLQEFSAAPTFVGEETREEIIESERQRIARELHDSVSQQLFAATMMISTVNEIVEEDDNTSSVVKKQLETIEEVIGNAQSEMRALLLHLRPIDLEDQSLEEGIEMLLKELETKVPMTIKYDLKETNLESGIEDHLFRIAQEALSNTLRHAKADTFELYLYQDDSSVRMRIVDDGIGFDVNDRSSGYGLRNIEERVNSMGGSFKVVSFENQGTVINISVPVHKKQRRS